MKFFRSHIVYRVFCVLMALHIFNICIDMPDAQPESVPEDLSVNDMESVIELILEKGFGIENAIAEHDEKDEGTSQNFEASKDYKIVPTTMHILLNNIQAIVINRTATNNEPNYLGFIGEISPPPPKS